MNDTLIAYGALLLAIICETVGTSCLKESEQFTRFVPSLITSISYICAFYLLSVTLKYMPVGIAYAIWCGVGIVLITIIGLLLFRQQLDLAAYIGISLIITGVVVISLFSKSTFMQ